MSSTRSRERIFHLKSQRADLKGTEGVMKRLDVTEFLREVLALIEELPPELDKKLLEISATSPTTRWTKIRDAIEDSTRG